MAAASDVDAIVDLEKTLNEDVIPNIPASILKYGTIRKISMILCGQSAVWKLVADELGFENCEISGHFNNYPGCDPAQNMLNEWMFKRRGTVPQLVRVFKALELWSCIEEVFADRGYQSACRYYDIKHQDGGDDDSDASSGRASIDDDNTEQVIPSEHKSELIKTKQMQYSESPTMDIKTNHGNPPKMKDIDANQLQDNSSPMKDVNTKLMQDNKSPTKDILDKNQMQENELQETGTKTNLIPDIEDSLKEQRQAISPEKKTVPKSPGSNSLISFKPWPESKSVSYNRCDSVPHQKPSTKKTFWGRSISVDTGKKKQKERKEKQRKKFMDKFLRKLRRDKCTKSVVRNEGEAIKVEGYYQESKQIEPTNLFPVEEAKIPECVDRRPISSGSEDSLPCQPSSPSSLGYESGTECEENMNKKIYIVANPDETEVFKKAYQLYAKFSEKGYECVMFATNFAEILEIGMYRYQMEQVKDADYLFLCVSEQLKEIFEESSKKYKGYVDDNCKSLRHVSDFIMSHLSRQCCNTNGKFMPILLAKDSHEHVPCFMGSYLRYKWPEQETRMENTIHKRTEYPVIPVSNTKRLAVQTVFSKNLEHIA